MRTFIEKHGHSLRTARERLETKKYLLESLARLRDEFLKYKSQPKDERRFQMFQERGISLDTNLWPDYLLDTALRSMLEKGMLKPGGVRRIAIVGPGLDFVNKEAGNDFYPPQTIQPFAVLDSVLRLGIANASTVEMDTLDISENVNVHVARIRQAAAKGHSYILQLPWNSERPMSEEYRVSFVEYWQKLGDKIGQPVAPIPVPEAAASTRTRAVKVRPDIVTRVIPLDVNVVYQRLGWPADRAYDLGIGTNIFLYYGAFEQSLARANVSAMLRPGGFLISNDKLADKVPSGLKDVLEVPVVSSEQPRVEDFAFCYLRAP
jgi:DNA-dependent RNA polymerase auxiliary subunit epsilon